MPRISKEIVANRENLLREEFRKNPKLKMEEAQVLLKNAGGPKMRPQRIYDLRKEVKEAIAKAAGDAAPTGTTPPAANRKGDKTTVKTAATKTPKATSTKKAATKSTKAATKTSTPRTQTTGY